MLASRREEMSRKFFKTFLSLFLACITSTLNQENNGLLQGSGPMRNILECSLVPDVIALSYSMHWTTIKTVWKCNNINEHLKKLLELSFLAICLQLIVIVYLILRTILSHNFSHFFPCLYHFSIVYFIQQFSPSRLQVCAKNSCPHITHRPTAQVPLTAKTSTALHSP